MKTLYVFYDPICGFCERCRAWMEDQPAYLELVFVPKTWAELDRCFPGLKLDHDNEFVVVGDDGGVYRHERAYLLCLYALEHYRELSFRLAKPNWMPYSRRAFDWLSRNRWRLSHWIGLTEDEERTLLRPLPREFFGRRSQ